MIKVKLRNKSISGNRQTLYLDFYPPNINLETNETTRREFLNLFLFNEIEIVEEKYFDKNCKEQKRFVHVFDKKGEPKKVRLSPVEKQHNKQIIQIAEQIRQKRDNELNKPEIYTGFEKEQLLIKSKGEESFVDYFGALADKRKSSNYDNWVSTLHHLKNFSKGQLKFKDLNERLCFEFREYLLTATSNKSQKYKLAKNTSVSYFNKFKAALKQAFKEGYFISDLNGKIDSIKQAETQRNFLTLEELNNLVKAECFNPTLKRAALFSALTGLRFSDIQKLVWSELEFIQGNGFFIKFIQQKTKGVEMMPISEQAYKLLGKRKQNNEKVFEGLTYSAYQNKHLAQWIGLAGIEKEITFHCFRHTFATLQLSKGTDIYTVSRMLGHRELKTTQIYAKIIDKTRREAAEKIQLDY